jgi:hypothetical protein
MPGHKDPDELLTLEEFATRAFLSMAFVRLVVECGCLTVDGRISQRTYADRFPDNYASVRRAAGLAPLPEPHAVTKEAEVMLRVYGCLRTVVDFSVSRCSDPRFKKAYAKTSAEMERWLDSERAAD